MKIPNFIESAMLDSSGKLNHFWPFYPINEVLDFNAITPKSIHAQIFSDQPNGLPVNCHSKERVRN